ncbi:hypothetical protein AGMMS49965_00050 [Bacteroidia bacterium]|nr:hypothetical protein AGMMS49965_00050 [Bacteroidia bacterium]
MVFSQNNEAAMQFLVVNCSVEGATIKIDGKPSEACGTGTFQKLLTCGTHQYTIEAPMYYALSGTVEIKASEKSYLTPDLKSAFAAISLNGDGDIYVNDERKAAGSWNGRLMPGQYKVEVRKASHRSSVRSIEVKAGENQTIPLQAPAPMYGSLNVSANVENAAILIDGVKQKETTPDIIKNVLIGKREIEIQASDNQFYKQEIEVTEGKILFIDAQFSKKAPPHPAEPEMIAVQGGTFRMGCSTPGSDCFKNERPAHDVTLSSFSIGKYEVTQAQWKLIMGTTIEQRIGESYFQDDNHPMHYVSWKDAQEFISRLNAATGKQYRLPTEAEWEYAARGGNKSQNYKYSGSHNISDVAWFKDNSERHTHPIGTKLPNELGIYDMSGNVSEWCSDWYGAYSSSPQQDPIGPSSGSVHVLRGGDGLSAAVDYRVLARTSGGNRLSGFRLAHPQ